LDQSGTAQRAEADQVLDKFVADVEHAISFSERTANAVTFTVPDRDGNGLPDTIRYAWSGTPGDPLTYEYNGSVAEKIAVDVHNFNLASMTRLMIAPVIPPAGGGNKLLFVVADPVSLNTKEAGRQALIEGWGYTVTLIDDGDSQANFDTAAADNDVVYVSGTISGGSLADKLTGSTTNIVSEFPGKLDNFGFCDNTSKVVNTANFPYSDASHYISSPFSGNQIDVFTLSLNMSAPSGNLAADLQNVAGTTNNVALAALEIGAVRYDSTLSPGRRVHLPFAAAETTQLTADGQTIMQRAIEWAASDNTEVLGAVAHWKFDETSGTTAMDSVGGHNGTLTNGPNWDTGTIDGGLSFDGSNDYVNVPHDDTLSLTTFSISAWIRPTALSGWQIIVSKGNNSSWNYYLGTNGSEIAIGFNNSSSWTEFQTSGAGLSTGQWYHLAGTFDDGTGEAKIYLNGSLVHTDTTTASPPTTSDAVMIGNSPASEYWPGMLDDVRIYDRVLGQAEIATLAGGGGGGGGAETFRDEFTTGDYAGSHGSLSWTTDWLEINESDGPTSGDDLITTDLSSDRLRVQDNDGGGEGVGREADLSAYTSATLSFVYRRQSLDNANDYVKVEVSDNGGGSWTELDRFTGSGTDANYQSVSYDISSYIAPNTRIRFLSSSNLGGNDIVYFDDVEISVE